MHACVLSHFSCVRLCVILWIVTHQTSLSMTFSRQEYWSGLPCLLQGIFPTQGLNPGLLHFGQSSRSEPQGSKHAIRVFIRCRSISKKSATAGTASCTDCLQQTFTHNATLSFLTTSCSLQPLLLPTSASKIPPSLLMYVKI